MKKQSPPDFPAVDFALIDWGGRLVSCPISGSTPYTFLVLTERGTTAVPFEETIVYNSKIRQYSIGKRVSERLNDTGFGGLRLVR